jgi:hypothetical protein
MGLLGPLLGGNFSFTPNHFSNKSDVSLITICHLSCCEFFFLCCSIVVKISLQEILLFSIVETVETSIIEKCIFGGSIDC